MNRNASVTVTFSLVFMVVFSFILSFFEMAAYTARASYQASASLLAVENYFANYLEPLYAQYHIFGREVPEGKDVLSWTEETIAKDVSYMTEKEEGEKSLLLRSGAEFSVKSADVLTSNSAQGFYTQATTAMKYQGVVEIKELLQRFMGVSKQADAHMEVAAAKVAADAAYAKVEDKLIGLIEVVDGVIISKYEQFLRDKSTVFQADVYVKYLCMDRVNAGKYFDRTEVYRAFLNNSVNQSAVLTDIIKRTEDLASRVRERENDESICREQAAEILSEIESVIKGITQAVAFLEDTEVQAEEFQKEIKRLQEEEPESTEAITELVQQEEALQKAVDTKEEEKKVLQERLRILILDKKEKDDTLVELEKLKEEQEKEVETLKKSEQSFLETCRGVAQKCSEAKQKLTEISKELEIAKKAKAQCEKVLDTVALVLGEEAVKEYQDALKEYQIYESTEGYDFALMQKTLAENEETLALAKVCFTGTSAVSLESTVEKMREERGNLHKYSFEGLKLNYGGMSLEENPYDGLNDSVKDKISKGILGLLTEKEVSEKALDKSYLPSDFSYGGEERKGLLSVLGLDLSNMFEEMRQMLPKDGEFGTLAETVTDAVLFHSYLATHFKNYMKENKNGALSYEIEYLIEGKLKDTENLSGVAMRLCMIRAALHFISLYTDNVRKMQAEQVALAACGVLGFPALISVVTIALLLVWAVEEAMIDTAALLQGKKLLLYPGKTGGSLTLSETLLFSKELILRKAKEKKEGIGTVFGYGDYLQVYLWMTGKEEKKYRALDLIQENLRKSYQKSFRVNRCVWRISYDVDQRAYSYAYDW